MLFHWGSKKDDHESPSGSDGNTKSPQNGHANDDDDDHTEQEREERERVREQREDEREQRENEREQQERQRELRGQERMPAYQDRQTEVDTLENHIESNGSDLVSGKAFKDRRRRSRSGIKPGGVGSGSGSRSQFTGSVSERTPLLDPSDPAVSPMNLESVRLLLKFLWILLFFSLTMTLILFVNTFVTLPLVSFRDSGFQELVSFVLSDTILLLSIGFFQFPLRADRILGTVSAASLFIGIFLSLCVPALRHRVTVGSFLMSFWTFVTAILGLVVTPIVVKRAKIHEEVRLTGRVETRKTFGEWIAIPFMVLTLFVLVVIPCVFTGLSVALDVYDYARLHQDLDTGKFVDIYPKSGYSHGNGHGDSGYKKPSDLDRNLGFSYSVYVYCTPVQGGKDHPGLPPSVRPGPDGRPAPIVLVEADSDTSAQLFYDGWLDEMYNNNQISQVCYWNRPGRGFSDNAPSPFSAGMSADALTIALRSALNTHADDGEQNSSDQEIDYDNEKKQNPFGNRTFAVVGHGIGGLYARVFAARHMQNMHSLTLVDAYPEELLVRRLGKPSHGFRFWWAGVWSVFGFERQISWIVRGRGPRVRVLGKMAASTRPNELRASLQEQISALGLMRNDIESSNSVLHGSDLPLAVLSSAQQVRADQEWANYQRALTKVTARNVEYQVLEGPHDMWLTVKAKKKMQEVMYNLLCQRDVSSMEQEAK